MARATIGRHPCVTGLRDRTNDNETPIRCTNKAYQELSGELIGVGHVTDKDMMIIRDPISSDWLVEDYAGETVLFHMPRECSLDEVKARERLSMPRPSKAGLSREDLLPGPRVFAV